MRYKMRLLRGQALVDEYPEFDAYGWGCKDCDTKKRELEDNEESFNYIRDELEKLMCDLTSKGEYFDYMNANLALSSICVELGVEFDALTVTRSQAFKIKREQE
jgi:hypothetical protein